MSYIANDADESRNAAFRVFRLGDATADPLAGIAFDPPRQSPELRHALLLAYPHSSTHEARIRDAIIDFLVSERNVENAACLPAHEHLFDLVDYDDDQPLGDLELTTSSPMLDMTPTLDEIHREIQSVASRLDDFERRSDHSASSAWKSMTSTWNPFNRKITKRGRKTPMTSEEKQEYRKIRKQGACNDCRKRKRKCSDDHGATLDESDVERPRVRRKADIAHMTTLSESSLTEDLPLPDLGHNFGNDAAFTNLIRLPPPSGLDADTLPFLTDFDPSVLCRPRAMRRQASNLSEKRRSGMSCDSEPGMTLAPSIDSLSLHCPDADHASISAYLALPSDFAHLAGVDQMGDMLLAIAPSASVDASPDAGPAKETTDMAWLGAWDQLFDVSLDEARTSLEGLTMGHDAA